jgi:uncharacterized membrane protein YdbT with pleckstrin-like domain
MDLATNEHVLFSGHPSWRSILGYHVGGLLIAVVAGVIGYFAAGVGLAILLFAAILGGVILVGILRRLGTTYTITNRRLYIKHGIVARRTQEANLQRVQNVNTEQSAAQRILQIGTVDFDTAGSGDADFAFRGVAQPEKVVRAVDRAQHEFQTDLAAEARGGRQGL